MATAATAQNSWESIKPLLCLPLVERLVVVEVERLEALEVERLEVVEVEEWRGWRG